eukprot:167347_1
METQQQTIQFDQLKKIVSKTLEKNGILAKTQAQLRKQVFEVLSINETENKSNGNLSSQIDENDIYDQFTMAVIRDFLECHHLDYTLSLMNTELQNKLELTQHITRNEIASKLGLGAQKPNPDSSLLKQLISKLLDSDVFKPRNSAVSNNIKLKQKGLNVSYKSALDSISFPLKSVNRNVENIDTKKNESQQSDKDNEYEDDFGTSQAGNAENNQNKLKLEITSDIILNVETDKIEFVL